MAITTLHFLHPGLSQFFKFHHEIQQKARPKCLFGSKKTDPCYPDRIHHRLARVRRPPLPMTRRPGEVRRKGRRETHCLDQRSETESGGTMLELNGAAALHVRASIGGPHPYDAAQLLP
ncbi:unnamed protein product [Dovyalis caffra]|uniref:Uncharacterized protein n=1 Tax=Dovyalis caffra TaxID=77055 RepID=A0AAV1RIQ8_9ROSI|nr:unnamed protein product [Dovyalis caffra]